MKRILLEIHQTNRFYKQFLALDKPGKIEKIVVRRAREIITYLQCDPHHEKAECKRTRHGELRFRGSRKYDLSCGFRLVGLRQDNKLIFAYIGSHDDCQRWIENNRENLDDVESTPIPQPFSEAHQEVISFQPQSDDFEQNNKPIFTYLGTHDDLENPKDIESIPPPQPSFEAHQNDIFCKSESDKDEYEEQLMAKIDENMLLEIFAGAIQHNKKEVLT